MNILVVTHYFWPENFRINDLVEEWVKKGHQVTVLTGKPNYPLGDVFPEYLRNPETFGEFKGARVLRVPMLARAKGSVRLFLNYLSFVLGASLFGAIRLRGYKPDVIFVYEPSPVTVGLPAVLLGKLKNAPVIFWALDLWPETLAAIGVVKSERVLNWVGHLVRFIYNRCELVLGQSKGFICSIEKYRDDKQGIRYFPSWAEAVFASSPAAPAVEVKAPPGSFNIVFAGNVGEAQDLPSVVRAALQLRHNPLIHWWIVGDGRKSDWLATEVEALGLADTVHLLGRFPVERMPSFYAAASALLVSLKKDPVFSLTIPGKVQSYLMAGVPMLGMLDGEGATVIKDSKCGLAVPAGDHEGLGRAVLQMASLPHENMQAFGLNGRNYAEREFAREGLMQKLDAMLNEATQTFQQRQLTT